jgi:serine phosphatase RsbU (regulator of sigma subunit)
MYLTPGTTYISLTKALKGLMAKAIICLLILFCNNSFAQTHVIDSLKNVLKTEKDDTNKVFTLNILSVRLSEKSDYDSSLFYSNSAKKLSESLNYKKGLAKALLNSGMVYARQNNYTRALECDQRSLDLYKQLGGKIDIAANYGNMGIICTDQGNYTLALDYDFKALALYREIGDKKGIATNIGNIGLIYQNQDEFDKALEYYNKAIQIQEEIGDKEGVAINTGNMGNIYQSQHNYAKAIEYDLKALEIARQIGAKREILKNLGNIGSTYQDQGNYPKALEYDLQALEISKQIGDQMGIAINFDNMGGVYMLQKKYPEAKKYLDSAIIVSKNTGIKDVTEDAYYQLSALDSVLGDFKASREDLKMYFNYQASLAAEANSKKAIQSEMNYEFEQRQAAEKVEQDKKDLLAQQDRKKQIIIRDFSIGGFAMMFALAFFIFRGYTQKRKDNVIIKSQKEAVDRSQKKVMDSIRYAQKIQYSILPSGDEIKKYVSDYFVCFMPKDIVSGDFYWFHHIEGLSYFAVVDCTGHGVPGACMSMLAYSFLNEVVVEKRTTDPAGILGAIHQLVYKTLQQQKGDDYSQDGMDISVIVIDHKHNMAKFAGARNNAFVTDGQSITVLKATPKSIGGLSLTGEIEPTRNFKSETFELKKGTLLVMTTDGIIDQLNAKDEPFEKRRFNALVQSLYNLPVTESKNTVETAAIEWKGALPQLDDILVMGIKV